jgi:uncharacterized protein (DUF1800 family)
MYSTRERIAHVVRRLGIGANPALVTAQYSVEEAITTMLARRGAAAEPPTVDPPATWDDVDYEIWPEELLPWWMATIASGNRPLDERLTWFWHDHFALSGAKVDHAHILWNHHRLIRNHALGNFAEMLHAVAKDPAMLWYLDGNQNNVEAPNENYGREAMELHTLGVGNYSQKDVSEIARCFTGWVINEPHWEHAGFEYGDRDPWSAVFDPDLFDAGRKTILGSTGTFDMDGALDVLLERPETGRYVAAALYREIVGLEPSPASTRRLGKRFSRDYSIEPLVEEIVSDPVFVSDEAIRAKVKSPLEKAATVMQGLPPAIDEDPASITWTLSKLDYLPMHPPNPAGFPVGTELLDPARILGSFELLYQSRNLDDEDVPEFDPFEALGLYDVSEETRDLIERFPRPSLNVGLAFGSPEFQLV